jgi:hypothetical protein
MVCRKAADFLSEMVCVHIHCLGNGCLGLRSYSASLLKAGMPAQSKVSKTLLPHHSVPRLGSACPQSDIDSAGRREGPSLAQRG